MCLCCVHVCMCGCGCISPFVGASVNVGSVIVDVYASVCICLGACGYVRVYYVCICIALASCVTRRRLAADVPPHQQ